jgi:hypothetical protein
MEGKSIQSINIIHHLISRINQQHSNGRLLTDVKWNNKL